MSAKYTGCVTTWEKVRGSLAQRGVAGTLRAVARKLLRRGYRPKRKPHAFDLEHGLDTSGYIGEGELKVGHVHDAYMNAYAGIPPSRFHETIRRWLTTPPAGPAEIYSFVDLGCGKGRAVLLASKLHFREVIGVELNPELARVAEANVILWNQAGKVARPIQIVCGDATEFGLPVGPCLLYLANPFGAPVLRRLLQRLRERAKAGGEVIEVLYQTPHQEAVFAEFPAFELLWSEVMPISKQDYEDDNVYAATDVCNAYRLRADA